MAAVGSRCKCSLAAVLALWLLGVSTADPAPDATPDYRPCDDTMNYGTLRRSGDTFYQDNLRTQAAECYRIATRINSKDEIAFFRMGAPREPAGDATDAVSAGNVARERSDLRSAMDHYIKAVVARHNFSEAHNNLGITYSEVGRCGACSAVCSAVQCSAVYGGLLTTVNRAESALASFNRALEFNPRLADAHYNRANVLKDGGQVGQAIQGYVRAVELQPDSVQASLPTTRTKLVIARFTTPSLRQ